MPPRSGLLLAHRVLITMAISLSVILLIHGVHAYRAHGDVPSLVTGLCAAGVAVVLAFYLRWFVRKGSASLRRRLQSGGAASPTPRGPPETRS
jgi:NADH:ubiquinone oxidoreductase subunit K